MKFKRLILVGALSAATMLCMAASGGCGSDLHKAEVSAGAIAATLHQAAQTNHDNTLETADERKVIAGFILQAAAANNDFVGVLTVAEKTGKIDTNAIATAFSGLVNRVDDLNAQGVLKIKSAQGQADLALAVSSIRAELAAIESLYPPKTSSDRRFPLNRRSPAPLAALALTAEEIEELIALAIAAGSALVPKLLALRGKSGAEILADASADDQAAIEIAEADGAAAPTT